MKATFLSGSGAAIALAVVGLGALPVKGALVIAVDMDPLEEGIQNVLAVAPLEPFTVEMVMMPGQEGVSSYAFSVRFRAIELHLVSVLEMPPAPLISLMPGVEEGVDEDDTDWRLASSLDGAALGAGPTNGIITVARMTFQAGAGEIRDEGEDLVPGYFAAGEGAFDNALPLGRSLTEETQFRGGSLVAIPEPRGGALLLGGLWLGGRRRPKRPTTERRNHKSQGIMPDACIARPQRPSRKEHDL